MSEVPISIKFPIWETSEVARTLANEPSALASAYRSAVEPSPRSSVFVLAASNAVVTSILIWKI